MPLVCARHSSYGAWLGSVQAHQLVCKYRKGITPVDHARNNMLAVRQMSKATRERRLRGDDTQHEEARVSTSAPTRYTTTVPCHGFRLGHLVKPICANACILCRQVEISGRNYVLENTKHLVTKRPAVREEANTLLKEVYGLVPRYLLRYKLDRAASAATKQVESSLNAHCMLCMFVSS